MTPGESDCGEIGYYDDGALVFVKMDRVNFYVTRLDDYPILERIDYEMEELLDERDDVIIVGDVVAVEVDGMMLRDRVSSVLEGEAAVMYKDY